MVEYLNGKVDGLLLRLVRDESNSCPEMLGHNDGAGESWPTWDLDPRSSLLVFLRHKADEAIDFGPPSPLLLVPEMVTSYSYRLLLAWVRGLEPPPNLSCRSARVRVRNSFLSSPSAR